MPSFGWVVIRSESRDLLPAAARKAFRGGAVIGADVPFVTRPGLPPRMITFAWCEGAQAARATRWPDVLGDWMDIYEEKPFGPEPLPNLAEELSMLGPDVLVATGEGGFARASAGWYKKGALIELNHVGGAQVSWTPDEGLGRPFDGSIAQLAGHAGKGLAHAIGNAASASVLDRMEGANMAVGETVLSLSLYRVVENEVPPVEEVVGMVEKANHWRVGV